MITLENKRSKLCLDLKESLAVLITESNLPQDEFKFSEVSCGYAGLISENFTLNARYFYIFLNSIRSLNFEELILFPQRVPRTGFFNELKDVSSNFVSARIECIQSLLSNFVEVLIEQGGIFQSVEQTNQDLNFLKLALRFGIELPTNLKFDIHQLNPSHRLPVIDIMINQAVSNDEEIPMGLLKNALDTSESEGRITLINRIIVATSRYDKKFVEENSDFIKSITEELITKLPTIKPINNQVRITLGTLYRGIPMSPFFNKDKTLEYLKLANEILEGINPESELDELVKRENLYTLYLTMSKYYLYQEINEDMFFKYQNKMIELDPYDSTPFCELGLYCLKQKNFSQAEIYFEKCVLLGPPSLAMSYYYLGESFENQGQTIKALEAYDSCFKYDPEAISPLLKKFEILRSLDSIKAYSIARQILDSTDLYEQLSEDEKCVLKIFSP